MSHYRVAPINRGNARKMRKVSLRDIDNVCQHIVIEAGLGGAAQVD